MLFSRAERDTFFRNDKRFWLRVVVVFLLSIGIHYAFERYQLFEFKTSLVNQAQQEQRLALNDFLSAKDRFVAQSEFNIRQLARGVLLFQQKFPQQTIDTEGLKIFFQADMMANMNLFQQIRLLDSQGMEVLRLNQKHGELWFTPLEQLQDKRQRYYVEELKKGKYATNLQGLERVQIYWSEIDLNEEFGEIERPLLPMWRCGVEIESDEGESLGFLVINIYADQLFKTLFSMYSEKIDNIAMLDEDGYFMFSTKHYPLWGRQLNIADEVSNAKFLDPWLWQVLQRLPDDNFIHSSSNRSISVTTIHYNIDEHGTPQRLYVALEYTQQAFQQEVDNFQHTQTQRRIGFALLYLLLSISCVLAVSFMVHRRVRRTLVFQRQVFLQEFAKFYNMLPSPVLLINGRFQIEAANMAACRLFVYSYNDLCRLDVTDLVPVDDRVNHYSQLKQFYSQDSEYHAVHKRVIKCLSSANEIFDVDLMLTTFLHKNEKFILVSLLDLRQQRQLEENFSHVLERLEASIELSAIGTFSQRERDGNFEIDPNMALHLDLSDDNDGQKQWISQDMLFKHIDLFDRTAFEQRLDEVWQLGGLLRFTLRTEFNHRPGKVLSVVIVRTLSNTDGSAYVLGVAADITTESLNQKQIEQMNEELEYQVHERTQQLEIALKELESFSYTVSHDLRSPLRAVQAYSQLLQRRLDGELLNDVNPYLENIVNSAVDMGQLIDDLLMLSRVATAEIHLNTCDVTEMCQGIVDKLREAHPHRKVKVTMERHIKVIADHALLKIMLTNLLENAFKYTVDRAEANIDIATCKIKDKRYLCIKDNGIGFPATKSEDIFKPFLRACDAEKYEGSGIGLATVMRIIKAHDGTIWVESAEGHGASFYLALGIDFWLEDAPFLH